MKSFFSRFSVCQLAALLFIVHLSAAAQAPAWQSARTVAAATTAAGSNYSQVMATAVDVAGNVYLTGVFMNSVVLGNTTLTSLGGSDVFVAKFNPVSNQFVWAQRAGGTGGDGALALAVSGTSVYVAGYFASFTAGFGSTTLTNADASRGTTDVFLVKLSDEGSFEWAQQAGGPSWDQASALAVSSTHVYVAGYFGSPTANFGTITLTNASNTGTYDVFVAKLTDSGSTGSFDWAQQAGGTGEDQATALAVSGTSVYVGGYFFSPTASMGATILTNVGNLFTSDVFVAKLTDVGSTTGFVWAQRAGSSGIDFARALAISMTSVYVAGSFDGPTAGFGPATLTNSDIVSNTDDIFVAKLTDGGSTGDFVWAQRAGGTDDDQAYALAVRGNSVYVAGMFRGANAGFGTTTLTSAGAVDMFMTKLTDLGSAGSVMWGQRAGGTDYDVATALVLRGSDVYVAGAFQSPTAAFGTHSLVNPTSNTSLGFLASLTDATLTATITVGPREPAALFPNPARHTATLRLPAGATCTPLTLTNAMGRVVRGYPAPTGVEATLDLRGVPTGFYLLCGAGPPQRLLVE